MVLPVTLCLKLNLRFRVLLLWSVARARSTDSVCVAHEFNGNVAEEGGFWRRVRKRTKRTTAGRGVQKY